MGDSSCLLHGFSYASAIPNEYKQGNPMHVLGESISFGRFTTESLSWEKRSTFSHKKYVEEAERYAQRGSVAQKKAFFEAYYKRIAAQKAAALLEQQNAAMAEAEKVDDDDGDHEEERVLLNVDVQMEDAQIREENKNDLVKINSIVVEGTGLIIQNEVSKESPVKRNSYDIENLAAVSASESCGTPRMERPLLKNSVNSDDPPSVTSKRRAKQVTPHLKKEMNLIRSTRKSNVESPDEKRRSPKSLRALLNLVASDGPENEPGVSGLPHSSFSTPAPACTKSNATYTAATPLSQNTRMKTPSDTSASGRKTTGPKWHILSAVCSKSLSAYRNKLLSPTVSTPFTLRTEERAAKRKQKLEEKFNASEAQKTQLQKTLKEKAGNEFRKLSCSLCFKASPLPEFYKERETPNNQMNKAPSAQLQSTIPGRSVSNKKQGTASMPPPPCLVENSFSKNSSKRNVANQSKLLARCVTHENASPNIQQ